MKIFEKDGRTNFVDDKNCFVGFDDSSSCCESWGHIISKEIPKSTNDISDETDLEGFNFDKAFFADGVLEDVYDGGSCAFRLIRGDEARYLTLHNTHNGYYGHGFDFKCGDETIESGSL